MKHSLSSSLSTFLKRFAAASTIGLMLMNAAAGAQARIIFQDDNFSDDLSEGFRFNSDDAGDEDVTLQLGNDGSDGTIIWDDGLSELIIGDGTDGVSVNSNTWDISGAGVGSGFTGFTSTGTVNFSGSSQLRIREVDFGGVFTGGGAPACANDGELAIDIGPASENLYICTDNATNTWTLVSSAAGDFLSAIASDTFGDGAGAGTDQTLTFGSGTDADTLAFTANSQLIIPTGTVNSPGDACTTGEIYFDTDLGQMLTCGNGSTFETAAPQDFEDVYAYDADNTLTASGTFDIDATGAVGIDSDAAVTVGGAGVGITSDGGILSLTGDGTNDIDISNTGAGIDFDSATFLIDATAGVSIDAGAASNFTTSAGALTLSGGDGVNIDGTGQEVDITSIGGNIDVNGAAITLDGTADSSFTTTGTSDITISAGDDIIFDDAQLTGTVLLSETATDFDATFSSDGIIDNINSFTSTATGEGASNIGIEDAGGNFTSTNVEGALVELYNSTDLENDVLTLEPEYPNVVVFQDGTNNRGRLDADYETQGANRENFYRWTTQRNASHDIDLRVRYELPTDFSATGDFTFRIKTATTTVGDNSIEVTFRNDTDDQTCHADGQVVGAAAGVWETITITSGEINTGCTAGSALAAGDIVEVQIKLAADNTSTGEAFVGTLEHSYTN